MKVRSKQREADAIHDKSEFSNSVMSYPRSWSDNEGAAGM